MIAIVPLLETIPLVMAVVHVDAPVVIVTDTPSVPSCEVLLGKIRETVNGP